MKDMVFIYSEKVAKDGMISDEVFLFKLFLVL